MSGTVPRGAYGFALEGVNSRFLGPAADAAPQLEVERGTIDGDPGRTVYERDRATVRLVDGGRAEFLRDERRARFLTREPLDDDELAHPYLAPAGPRQRSVDYLQLVGAAEPPQLNNPIARLIHGPVRASRIAGFET